MPDTPPSPEQPEPEYPTEPTPAPARRSSRPRLIPAAFAAAGLVLGIIATVLISSFAGSHRSTPPAVAAPQLSRAVTSTVAPALTRAPTTKKPSLSAPALPVGLPPAQESGLNHSAPTGVEIPKIGVSSTLVSLGLAGDGTLQVPTDFSKAGWYSSGAYPGDANEPPALIVGHVDNYKGPAVFFRLKELGVGDRVLVPRADGTAATFVVYRTANYLKTSFPAQSVYAATGRPELRLITCTGQFDSNARSYLSNFVAYAYLATGSK